MRDLLEGCPGPRRDAAILNAAATLVVGGRVKDMTLGVEKAAAAIDDGSALAKMEALIELTAGGG